MVRKKTVIRSWLVATIVACVGACAEAGSNSPRSMVALPDYGNPEPVAGVSGSAFDPLPPSTVFPSGSGGMMPVLEVGEECASVSQSTEPMVVERHVTEADVIWIVDSSFSMFDEAARVQENLNAFVELVEASALDVRVVMITAAGFVNVPAPLGTDAGRYLFVDEPVDSPEGLSDLIGAFPRYSSFLRPKAETHFIAVSDDESFLPAQLFSDEMTALLGRDFTFHAIVSEDVSGPVCNNLAGDACGGGLVVIGAAAPGCQYIELTQATAGIHMSICTPPEEWPGIFTGLGNAVVESIPVPLPCDYLVPAPPSGDSLDQDKVNVEYTPASGTPQLYGRVEGAIECQSSLGWYYDDSAELLVSLCPASCNQVAQGGAMRLLFGCDTVLIAPQ